MLPLKYTFQTLLYHALFGKIYAAGMCKSILHPYFDKRGPVLDNVSELKAMLRPTLVLCPKTQPPH